MVLESLFDPIFSPLLGLHPGLAILLIALLVSLLVVLVYKKFTDQDLMKRLKDEIKELQEEMKRLKDKPDEMMKVQKQAMETNMKYMMKSFKPTLITFIPIIIIFGWLNVHFAFEPLVAGNDFSVALEFVEGLTGPVTLVVPEGLSLLNGAETSKEIYAGKTIWFLHADKSGEYRLLFTYTGKEYVKDVIIVQDASERKYASPVTPFRKDLVKSISLSNEKMTPFGSLSIFGYQPGWLMTYIVFSLVFSLGLRKWMKVY